VSALARSAIAILDRLVAFDTVSRNPNLPLIEWVREYLAGHGVAAAILPGPAGKANLFATIGPAGTTGVLLSGHTDVVPVNGQVWSRDPFRLVEMEGRLYGRGTCDMKGYVACMLAIVPRLVEAPLRRAVHLGLSYDEEVGCYGAPGLVSHMAEAGIRPAAAFVGEPSMMGVVNGHKGSAGLLTRVTGRAVHSSRPDLGVSALYAALDMVAFLRRRAEELAAAPDSLGLFDPPYTTISVGALQGGTARNAVPGDCRIEWDIRATRNGLLNSLLAETEAEVAERILPAMRERAPEAAIVTEMVYDVPALLPEPMAEAELLAKRLAGRNAAGTVPYGSEAGIFQRAGIPTVICGPGDIVQAHTADEWIAVAEIERCLGFLERLIAHETLG
jgi:acetylornithine deacetylase